MDLELKNKVAIVTASSKGLGKAVAFELAREGCQVVICARDKNTLEETAEDIRSATDTEVLPIVTDLTKAEDIKKLIKETITRFARIDILFTNAGGPPPGQFMDFNDEDWKNAFELNLLSVVRLCKEVIPYMQRQGGGRIIHSTSISVKQPLENLILSNSLRAGVIGLSKTLANELGAYNILVNAVCPGATATERLENLVKAQAEREGISEEEAQRGWTDSIPLGRLGTPKEFASLVVFLASEKASNITGTAIQVDGGFFKGIL
ncbi:MAG: SDR family oxidoreductase [Promethearchaeota archaeon]